MSDARIIENVTTDLATARKQAGLTQHELVDRLEGFISRSYLAMIETGDRPFPEEHRELITQVLTEAVAERQAFQQRIQAISAELFPFTGKDRLRLEIQREIAEEKLARAASRHRSSKAQECK